MAASKPKPDDLREAAVALRLDVSSDEMAAFTVLSEGVLGFFQRLDQLEEPKPPVKYPRSGGRRPSSDEDPLNAWYWKCSIKGAETGLLAGKKIAIKDNVCVAGMPMMNGSDVLEGYIPDVDATVVTRILDAGGEIAGKAVCESFCLSGGSHMADTGPTHNPRKRGYSSGGSSSGSAALVGGEEVDLAIGADQAGSIRVPSSWCGIFGLKPTFGLVPYTGASSLEYTIDHLGPMARTAADAALLLDVIAGPDGYDSRQAHFPKANAGDESYRRALTGDVKGLRIAVVKEAFAWEGMSESDVDEAVREAAHRFEERGASVSTVSLPFHRDGMPIFMGIGLEGVTRVISPGNGMGNCWKGFYTTSLIDAYARGVAERSSKLSAVTKFVMLIGRHFQDRYRGHYYAKAQNLALTLKRNYDEAFEKADLLALPTTPMKARPLPSEDADVIERVARALEQVANTCPFNVTGHPSLNVPCGVSEGLPVGMLLVGRCGEDATVLRAGDAYDRIVG